MDEGTKENLVAGLRNYKAALKALTAKLTAAIEGDVELTPERAQQLQIELDGLTEARRMYDDAVDAAGLSGQSGNGHLGD